MVESPYAALMERIARTHSGVEYDAQDPQLAMIEAAARAAGLELRPSETITPRTIRGCTGDGDVRPLPVLSMAIHASRCGPHAGHPRPNLRDNTLATRIIAELATNGYHVVRAGV